MNFEQWWTTKEFDRVVSVAELSKETVKQMALITWIAAHENAAEIADAYFSQTTSRYAEDMPYTIGREIAQEIRGSIYKE